MSWNKVARLALLAATIGTLLAPSSQATTTSSLSLADLVKESAEIVVGVVTDVSEGREGNLPYTQVTVALSDAIRGAKTENMTFRQFGLVNQGEAVDGRKPFGGVQGVPVYHPGEEVMLFLGPVSTRGFRTTVGLAQGKFTIRAGNVENGMENNGLFRNLPTGSAQLDDSQRSMLATREGAVRADTFIDFVRQGVQQRWWN